jgi:hypothetical protein
MQLDATLRSFRRHCADADLATFVILYRATSEIHESGYRRIARDHPGVTLVEETDFRMNVIDTLATAGLGRRLGGLARHITGTAPKLMPMFGPWQEIARDRTVLFLVDDNIFVRDFSLSTVTGYLDSHPDAIGFSLRLGTNTSKCYAHDRPQHVPSFTRLPADVMKFDWTRADLDFAYPFEVSSSVYRIADVLPVITAIRFHNPNTLEGYFAGWAGRFASHAPYLLAFERSVTFCNPANKVQIGYEQNRAGGAEEYSPDRLGELFLAGHRIDIERYDGHIPAGCHEEVDLFMAGQAVP